MSPGYQHFEIRALALGDDLDPAIETITYPSGQSQPLGLVNRSLAEAYSLHATANQKM